jgi:hypothetical protein
MAGNSVANIGVGAPLATGGITVFDQGATLPTDIVPISPVGSRKLGLVADDGLRPSGERTSTPLFDWAGDVIYSPQDQHSTAFQFKLYSAFDADVLMEAFGTQNVQVVGDLITVLETGTPLPVHPWMFDMRDGGKRVRIVPPEAQITGITESPFIRNGLQAFDCTLTCYKDASGVKAYRYYNKNAALAAGVPVISSRNPSTPLATAGGDPVLLTGANFTGTVGVTIDGDAADFLVLNDSALSIVTPPQAAGSYALVVTNATGASSAFSVTYA